MSFERTVKCPICGKPYKFMPYYAGDQSACRECVAEAERATQRKSNQQERERRQHYFNN